MPTMTLPTPTERAHDLATLTDEQRKAVRWLVLEFKERVDEMLLDLDEEFVEVQNR